MEDQFESVINESFKEELDFLISQNEEENNFLVIIKQLKKEIIRLKKKEVKDEERLYKRIHYLENLVRERDKRVESIEKSLAKEMRREEKEEQKQAHKEYKKKYWKEVLKPRLSRRKSNATRRKNNNRKIKGESSERTQEIIEVEKSPRKTPII